MTIKDEFRNLRTKEDAAALLDLTVKELNAVYGRHGVERYYHCFEIPKKNGTVRVISCPTKTLRFVLEKLSKKLSELYADSVKFNEIAHGFFVGRSIVTNAETHFNNTLLLNLDLRNFFGTITYSRINGMFRKGFGVGEEASKILSLLVCYRGSLPQGSPCSPIISNMICKRLDTELYSFGKKCRLRITRYADDITVSSSGNYSFSKAYEFGNISGELVDIIIKNGFDINEEKTRALYYNQRKEVTGIIINEKINVPRKFVRNLRAQMHNAQMLEKDKRDKMFNELYGHIGYIRQIKSSDDRIFIKYALKFNKLYGGMHFKVDEEKLDIEKYINNRVVVIGYDIKMGKTTIENAGNGTGFFLKIRNKYYLATCYHVLMKTINECGSFRVFSVKSDRKELICEYTFSDYYDINNLEKYMEEDILLLETENPPEYYFDSEENTSILKRGTKVQVIGYPNFVFDSQVPEQVSIIDTSVTSQNIKTFNTVKSISIFGVNSNIFHGVSGGPVINSSNRIIGIASNGVSYVGESQKEYLKTGFIPSMSIIKLLDSK